MKSDIINGSRRKYRVMFGLFDFAYLDPATGSLLIQSIIGMIAGIGIFGRRAIGDLSRKAKGLFVKNKEH